MYDQEFELVCGECGSCEQVRIVRQRCICDGCEREANTVRRLEKNTKKMRLRTMRDGKEY